MLAWTCVAGVGVRREHLAGDLGVAGLVGADEAELVAAEEGDKAVEEDEDGDGGEDDELPRRVGAQAARRRCGAGRGELRDGLAQASAPRAAD